MSLPSAPPGIDLQPVSMPESLPGLDGWCVRIYAHTHWDREWYRTFERFRMQLVGVVDRLLHVLDSDPAFSTFVLDGQTIVLEDYLAIRPEEEPRVRRLVAAGRIEVGPWHVLPDEFLVSAEALVRNLAEGRRVASRFGDPVASGYLPDPFGHVAQMPLLLRGFGIDNVIFSRGMGAEFARTGSEFRWEALDGTDVLAIVQLSTVVGSSGYCNAETFGRGYAIDDAEPWGRIRELLPLLTAHSRTGQLLLAAGCDHDTVQQDLPAMVERVRAMLPGADVRISGLGGYVAGVRDAERARAAAGEPLERYRGELRGSLQAPILSSIFSARVPLKQANDALQVLLERHVEPLACVAVAAGVRPHGDVAPFLRHAWRLVLENHPHDSIGGCSVDLVHEEMHARSLRARAVADGLLEDLRIALQLGEVDVVHDAHESGGIVERADGTPIALAPGAFGRLRPLDVVGVAEGARVAAAARVEAGATSATVEDRSGTRILVVEHDGHRATVELVDDADHGDEYDFGSVDGAPRRHAEVVAVEAVMAGPGVACLSIGYALPSAAAPVVVQARVSAASQLVELCIELDNAADDHRVRLRVVPEAGGAAGVEALGHFAHVARPMRPVGVGAGWRQEPPGLDHCLGAARLVDEDGGPVALVAGRGHHEYEAFDDGSIELTLLRSIGWLSRDDVPGRPGHAGPALETPGAQCRGAHRFDVAVGVGAAATLEGARTFLEPPLLLEAFGVGQSQYPSGRGAPTLPLESGAIARARDVLAVTPDGAPAAVEALGLQVEAAGGAVWSACKLADDGSGDVVVRWWAPSRSHDARGVLRLGAPVDAVLRARLDETPLGPAPWEHGRCEVRIPNGGVTTLRVRLSR